MEIKVFCDLFTYNFDNLNIPFLYKFGNCLFEKEWVYSMSLNFRSSSSFMHQKKHFRTESYVSLNLNICLQYWQAQKGSMVTSETGNKV